MDNTTTINIFNSDKSNIGYDKAQNYQIMATIANRILAFESMITKPIVENHALFIFITFIGSIPLLISILS